MKAALLLAAAICIGRPSPTLRGWKEISNRTLPGDQFAVAYVCSGADRRIVVERFANRFSPEARYVADATLPKLVPGEVLLEGKQCTLDGKADPYIVPFGAYTKTGASLVRHAWRVELPSASIVSVNALSVKCEARKLESQEAGKVGSQ